MATFADAIHGWETFYLLTGTAGVTLIGLLFIAISINIELFRDRFSGDLRNLPRFPNGKGSDPRPTQPCFASTRVQLSTHIRQRQAIHVRPLAADC